MADVVTVLADMRCQIANATYVQHSATALAALNTLHAEINVVTFKIMVTLHMDVGNSTSNSDLLATAALCYFDPPKIMTMAWVAPIVKLIKHGNFLC